MRPGINKRKKLRPYLEGGLGGGFLAGLVMFGGNLLDPGNTLSNALFMGFFWWSIVIFLYMAAYMIMEYCIPKEREKRLRLKKYIFLYENGFRVDEEFFFEGKYKGYACRIFLMSYRQGRKKDIEYDLIQVFYANESEIDNIYEKEEFLSGEYYGGNLSFSNNSVIYLPKDWEKINFKESLDGLIHLLNREGLPPISIEQWEEKYGTKLKEEKEEDIRNRTKQILKIGNLLDIKYIKPEA